MRIQREQAQAGRRETLAPGWNSGQAVRLARRGSGPAWTGRSVALAFLLKPAIRLR